ncbi:hypothetical protein P9112_012750 [Eukaryota sp. TZLM1-RC]
MQDISHKLVDDTVSSILSAGYPLDDIQVIIQKVSSTVDRYISRVDELLIHINICQQNRLAVNNQWKELHSAAERLASFFTKIDSMEQTIRRVMTMVSLLEKGVSHFQQKHQEITKGKARPDEKLDVEDLLKIEDMLADQK